MQALKDLMGEVTALNGRVRLSLATILVVCRNGKPVKVVRPGRSYWRGLGMPIVGGLEGIPVSTATHIAELDIRNIALDGPFSLPSLRVAFGIKLSDRDDYRSLLRYVDVHGLAAAQQLEPQVRHALDSRVRESLRPYTHEALFQTNLRDLLSTESELLDGLFSVENVAYCEATWDTAAERIARAEADWQVEQVQIRKDQLVTQARLRAELEVVPDQVALDAAELERRIALAERESAATGLTVVEIMQPELARERADRTFELLKTLMENPRSAGSPHIRALMDSVAPNLSVGDGGGVHRDAGPQPIGLNSAGDDLLVTPALRMDAALDDALHAAGVDVLVLGSGFAQRGDKAAALIVVGERSDPPATHSLSRALTKAMGVDVDTWVVRHDPQLQSLVRTYLGARMRALSGADTGLRVSLDNDRLVIGLSVDHGATSIRRQLVEPQRLILEPLARTLPYEAVDVVAEETVEG